MGRTLLNATQIIRPYSCHLPNNMLPFLSSIICLLFLLFSLTASSAYRPIMDGTRKHLDHNPYKPPGGCKTIPEPNPRRLTVYHNRGPCSPTRHNLPVMDAVEMTDGTREGVNLGSELGIDNYVVTIGLGTPPRDMTVVMDTGSAITWVQCFPCDNCHDQKDYPFKPDMSSTYQTVDCNTNQCLRLPSNTGCSANDSCSYKTTYMDHSYSSGQYASDLLTLNAGNTIGNFLFGCGQDQSSPLFGQTSGLLGLGPSSPSLLNQAAGTSIGQNFAYCLPQADSTGYLELGPGADDAASAFATLTLEGDSYNVELVGVGVNGADLLSVTSTKMMVDTGTVLSQLPTELYSELKASVEAAAGEALVQEDNSSDGCYEIQVANGTKELLPINVTLKLDGGAELVLDNASVFYQKESLTCLAFVEKMNDEEAPVLGNMLQRTYRWSYDLDNRRIGITPNAC